MELLDPKKDLTFKRVFAENPDVLLDMLNSILPLEIPITKLEYLSPELLPVTTRQKISIVDVRCTDDQNRHFIVEMQVDNRKNIRRRMLYNTAKIISRELYPNQDFGEIRSVYSLCFLEGSMYSGAKEWFHHFRINHNLWPDVTMEGVDWFYVELGKWRKIGNFNIAAKRDVWLTFLTEPEKLNTMLTAEYENQYKEARKALNLIDKAQYTPEQLWAMERNADELYFAWEGIRLDIEEAKKQERQRIVAIIKDLRLGIEAVQIAQRYGVEIEFVESLRFAGH